MSDDDLEVTRRSYDEGASRYVDGIGTTVSATTETALDQSVLGAFAEAVRAHPVARVADVGCGPGRAAAFVLASAEELEVLGVDLSLGLLRAGHGAHARIPFAQGVLASLPLRTGAVGGAVSWYSVIHTRPDRLPAVAAELARIVAPGGQVLVAFQAGAGEALQRAATHYLHAPDDVARVLEATGLHVTERIVRPAELAHETAPQAFILARR